MAVHVPLGNAAVLEAQMLMLASHNILNPANGAPITVPSQDMVLGLYYITKGLKSTDEYKVPGENKVFYSPEEVIIAYNEKKVHLNAYIKCKVNLKGDGNLVLTENYRRKSIVQSGCSFQFWIYQRNFDKKIIT